MRRTWSFWRSTSIPSRSIEPESGSCRVATVRIRELLPAPFGPTRPNILLPMESERLLIALTPLGYVLERPVIVKAKRLSPGVPNSAVRCGVVLRTGNAGCSLNGFSILPAFGDGGAGQRVQKSTGAL